MNRQNMQERTLIKKKIRSLPPERVAEVEDFVDFLRQRDEEHRLVRAFSKLSQKSFQRNGTTPTMQNTTDYKFGDVVLVPFPFTDQAAAKTAGGRRKFQCLQSATSGYYPMAVTSQMQQPHFGDVVVKEWQQAGL